MKEDKNIFYISIDFRLFEKEKKKKLIINGNSKR